MGLQGLLRKIKSYNKNFDVELIKKAYEFSAALHQGQKRKSKEDYIVHPLETAYILAGLKLDDMAISAGLLHDVLEDTNCDYEKLKKEFGKEIADLVNGVSKIKELKAKGREKYNAESMKKLLLASSKDIRVVIVKLADKLHNMRTISALEEDKRKRISNEVLEVYAPLAYRLGLAGIKWELEDLAFKELHPEEYKEFSLKIAWSKKQRENEILKLKKTIAGALRKNHVKFFEISGRAKNFYSIYKKMIARNKKFEELYDLIGLRVIVENVKDCYECLGVIHGLWKPLPGRFKDYIARPKENLYRSLHTLVIADDIGGGLNVEVQIRTRYMDDVANEGVAAHWRYKDSHENKKELQEDKRFDRKLGWVKQILELKNEPGEEFLKNVVVDVFGDKVYAFTPKGDLIELPDGSCLIDFAYAVHSELGNKCVGGRVNDKFVSLRHLLHNGDVVEVIIDKNRLMPSRDWLKFVRSEKARVKIRHALQLIQKIPAGSGKIHDEDEDKEKGGLVDVGLKAIVSFGRCCNPLPGDELIGLISRSNRVMVHRKDCEKIKLKREFGKQRVKAYWREKINNEVGLKIIAYDRIGLFADISNTLAGLKINVIDAKAYTYGKKDAACEFRMHFNDINELKDVVSRVKKIADVREVGLLG